MDDYFLDERKRLLRFLDLKKKGGRFKGVKRTKKINILIITILALSAGLFFSSFFGHPASAEQSPDNNYASRNITDPMKRIRSFRGGYFHNLQDDKICLDRKEEVLDTTSRDTKDPQSADEAAKYMGLVKDYPMAEMVPYISQRDKKTASFLIAIAKKESDWGVHSPSLDGRDCHNYWGYKGSYNLVDGYSCFDSAEQAVQVVGDRIDQLVSENIDTPQRMLVWKCGGNCKGDTGAAGWVATISGLFDKLNS